MNRLFSTEKKLMQGYEARKVAANVGIENKIW